MDILITKRRDRAYVIGVTDKGRNHLFEYYELKGSFLDIAEELADETSKDLIRAGLVVDIK